jgi:hypothetical protein
MTGTGVSVATASSVTHASPATLARSTNDNVGASQVRWANNRDGADPEENHEPTANRITLQRRGPTRCSSASRPSERPFTELRFIGSGSKK